MDCHVADAPRNDGGGALLAMTMKAGFDIGKKQEVNYGLL